ncbi:sensor histidine kinase [Nocardioides sp. L-11A]|uniref:sensor histidine kinase n=1 Tax=Nocardioides sp. L-11A TaxID=3043848 RepID=UPI00249B6110|nr:histidine kinase [Nocardioides sp. L-11A]
MTRLRRLVVVPLPFVLLLDLVSWTNPLVFLAMVLGVALQVDAERTVRAWSPREPVRDLARGRYAAGLVAAGGIGAVLALDGIWCTTLAWGLIVQTGVAAGLQRGPADRLLVALTALLAVVLPIGLWNDGSGILMMFATVTACTISVAIGVLARSQEERVADARELMRTQERARMAADLHDLVAHEVTGIVVLAQAAGAVAPDPGSADAFARIERSAHEALGEIRALVAQSADTPAAAPGAGLAALRDVTDRFAATTPARVEVDLPAEEVSGAVGTVLLRGLTESLTNVHRHARPTRVRVRLDRVGGEHRLRVDNDGVASGGVGPGNGSGLARVRHRAELLGGSLRAGPAPDGCWETELRLPVEGP